MIDRSCNPFPVIFTPLNVDVAVAEILPTTASSVPGVFVPLMPTRPRESIKNAVPVENVVEVDTAKRGMVVEEESPATESLAKGVVVPMPTV